MDFRDVTALALDEFWGKLEKAVEGLSDEEIRWRPTTESNHVLWLVWHCGRVEDGWMNYLRGLPESSNLWVTEGWSERFGLADAGSGYGDSAADVAAFPDVPVALALEYFRSVREKTLIFLDSMTAEDLPQKQSPPDEDKEGPTTAWTLAHLLVELS